MKSVCSFFFVITMLFVSCEQIAKAQTNCTTYHLAYSFDNPPKLIFDTAGNYFLIERVCDLCSSYGRSDTISYGKYVRHKNNLYFLFSDPSATSNQIKHAEVQERVITNLNDSVLIVLNSPFAELDKDELFFDGTVVVYIITIWYDDSKNKNNYVIRNPQRFTTMSDSIVVLKPSNIPINKIKFEAVCNCPEAKRSLQYTYEPQNGSSNSFIFYFKDFLFKRFFYRSFYAEPIVFIDDNTIDFERQLFQKEEKRIKRFPNGERYYDIYNKVKEDPYLNESE